MSDHLARLHGWLKDTEAASIAVEDGKPRDERTIEKTIHPRPDEAQLIHPIESRVQRSLPPSFSGGGQTKLSDQDGTPETKLGQTDSDHEDEHTYPHHGGKPTCSAYDEPIYLDYEEQTYSGYEDEQTYSDYEDEQTWSDFEGNPLEPGDSMSQTDESNVPNLRLPPTRPSPTPSVLSKLTAGGDKPSNYFRTLAKAGVVHTERAVSHSHLYNAFEPEVLIAAHPADGQTPAAVEDLRVLADEVRDWHISEFDLHHEMHCILKANLNPPRAAGPALYVFRSAETWNRIPENIRHEEDLSLPCVDMLICINPSNAGSSVPFESDLHHPLSPEAMRCVLEAVTTREKAPVKSTRADLTFRYVHDSTLLKLKDQGLWKNSITPGARSEIMEVAQSQACNGMNVQLGSIAQLFSDVRLEGDSEFDRFVLSMTICGDLWTVEYATRPFATKPATYFTTIAHGNWGDQPEVFLAALKEVIKQNMINLEDKARRMHHLHQKAMESREMKPAGEPAPKIEIAERTFARSAKRLAVQAASAQKRAERAQAAVQPHASTTAGAGNLGIEETFRALRMVPPGQPGSRP